MGVRVMNGVRGLFGTLDPVQGGGENGYAYPTDPMNTVDISGCWWVSSGYYQDSYTVWLGIFKQVHTLSKFRVDVHMSASETKTFARWGTIIGAINSAVAIGAVALAKGYGLIYAYVSFLFTCAVARASFANGRGMVISVRFLYRDVVTNYSRSWFGWSRQSTRTLSPWFVWLSTWYV
jgi:hypothetical protein